MRVIGVIAVLAAIAVTAVDQRNDARRQRDRAEAQERIAVSRQLAAQALAELPEQPDRALLLSLESLNAQAGPHGRDALLTSLQRVSNAGAYLDNEEPVLSLAYSRRCDPCPQATMTDRSASGTWTTVGRSASPSQTINCSYRPSRSAPMARCSPRSTETARLCSGTSPRVRCAARRLATRC